MGNQLCMSVPQLLSKFVRPSLLLTLPPGPEVDRRTRVDHPEASTCLFPEFGGSHMLDDPAATVLDLPNLCAHEPWHPSCPLDLSRDGYHLCPTGGRSTSMNCARPSFLNIQNFQPLVEAAVSVAPQSFFAANAEGDTS